MPILDYKCDKCGFVDEVIVGATTGEKPPEKCSKCNEGKMEKIFSTGKTQAFDIIGSCWMNDNGIHAWRKHLSQEDQTKCLTPDHNGLYKDPY